MIRSMTGYGQAAFEVEGAGFEVELRSVNHRHLDVKARLLIAFDTSGSMNLDTCGAAFSGGDGSNECPGSDVTCATCGEAGCSNGVPDDSRLDKVKEGISDVVAGFSCTGSVSSG